jgi:hypothetical protein
MRRTLTYVDIGRGLQLLEANVYRTKKRDREDAIWEHQRRDSLHFLSFAKPDVRRTKKSTRIFGKSRRA